MMLSAADFLRGLPAKPFVVQFVLSLTVGGNEEPVTQVSTYLLPANSREDAHASAQEMIESLSDCYRNSNGDTVTVRCEGIHTVEELDHVDEDGRLELGIVQFSRSTRPHDLTHGSERADLVLLD